MEFTISGQTWIFLLACLLGVAFSLLYDVFRILRITLKTGKVATAIEDIVFFLLVTVSTFLFLLRFTEGMIRFYVLLGELLGFIVCHLTASAVIVKLLGIVIRAIKRAISFVYGKTLHPLCCIISKYVGKICKFFVNKLHKYRPKRKKDLKNTKEIMYNHTIRFQKKRTKVGERMAKSKRKSRKKNIVIALLVLAFAAYAIVSLSVSSAKIAEERKQIAYLQSQKEELETQGKEYDRLTQEYDKQVEEGETIEYAEKVARDKLGLVSPDERVWVDIAGS